MSEQINDGGPAFPVDPHWYESGTGCPGWYQGMTLRDYFAAKAMQAIPPPKDYVGRQETRDSYEWWAAKCWRMADVMLAAREVKA